MKPTRCTNFYYFILIKKSTCFGQFICPSSVIFSLYTQQWYTFAENLRALNLYDIHNCCVYSEKLLMMDGEIFRNITEFYSKNKFEKLVHRDGFIIRIVKLIATERTENANKFW